MSDPILPQSVATKLMPEWFVNLTHWLAGLTGIGTDWMQWLTPALFVLLSLFIGWVLQRVLVSRLKRWSERTSTLWDDALVYAIDGLPIWMLFLMGVLAVTPVIPVSGSVRSMLYKLLLVGGLLLLTFTISRLVVAMIRKLAFAKDSVPSPVSSNLVVSVSRGAIFILGGLIVLEAVGIPITPVLTALGVGGLAVALALQDTLTNLFAGLQIILSGKVRPGDYIELSSGEAGYVIKVNWRSTRIRNILNYIIIIPNKHLSESVVTNYYMPEHKVRFKLVLGVHYDSDLEHVERVTCEVALKVVETVEGGMAELKPFILYHAFSDSSINFDLVVQIEHYEAQLLIAHELIKQISARYKQEGIVIPYPIRTLEWGKGKLPLTETAPKVGDGREANAN